MKDLDTMRIKPIEILLAEDNPGDARLTVEGFKDAKVNNNIMVVEEGAATEGRFLQKVTTGQNAAV